MPCLRRFLRRRGADRIHKHSPRMPLFPAKRPAYNAGRGMDAPSLQGEEDKHSPADRTRRGDGGNRNGTRGKGICEDETRKWNV